jgi:hypothetical protein
VASVNRDRGQLLIITALLLAILFVGLALILNSGIYTENLSTRETGGSMEPFTNDPATVNRLSASMRTANYYNDTVDYGPRRAMIRRNVSAWKHRQANISAQHGQYMSTEVTGMQNGTRVNQSTTGDFMTNDSDLDTSVTGITIDPLGIEGRTTWIPAPNVSTRNFEMTVKRSSLEENRTYLLDELIDTADWVLTGGNEFVLQTNRTTGPNEMWRIYLVNDSVNDSVTAVVTKRDGTNETIEAICSAPGETVTVQPTGGVLVGDNGPVECPELQSVFGGERNNVFFVGADRVQGTYQFIVDKPKTQFEQDVKAAHEEGGLLDTLLGGLGDTLDCLLTLGCTYNPEPYSSTPTPDRPYTAPAVYSTSVEMTYTTDRMQYTRNVTFAPETTES